MIFSSPLFVLLQPILLCLFLPFTLTFVKAATTNEECVDNCSIWSVKLGYCRGVYPYTPALQTNETYTNEFLQCLCQGQGATDRLESENNNMTYAASFCMGCDSTPKEVKANLGDLLDLCAVQAANGTAGNATTFTPFGYDTSQHASSNGSTTSGSQRSSFIGSEIGMSGIGMLLVGLAGWLGLSLVTLG